MSTIMPQMKDRNGGIPVEQFKDTKIGKRVFLLGNGPSLRQWTMAELKALKADTIGINRSWKSSADKSHKGFQGTTYHCFVSGTHGYNLCDKQVRTGVAFAPSSLRWLIDASECGCGCKYSFVGVLSGSGAPQSFAFDLERGITTKFAGYFAVQLAAYMGYSEIYLLGFSARDREGHAYDVEPAKGVVTRNGMRRWFRGVAEWAEKRTDRTVINCDPDSAIEFLPKLSKEETMSRIQALDSKEASL